MPIRLPEQIAKTWLLQSFRYCLGRRTYAVSECVGHLQAYWGILPTQWQQQIHDDIREAIKNKRAGMEMDVADWEKVLELKIKKES